MVGKQEVVLEEEYEEERGNPPKDNPRAEEVGRKTRLLLNPRGKQAAQSLILKDNP